MKLLIGILFIGFVAYVLFLAFNHVFSETARANRQARKAGAAALTLALQRERIATKALRAIANGAGAPLLEAQDALDKIETTYDNKEIL